MKTVSTLKKALNMTFLLFAAVITMHTPELYTMQRKHDCKACPTKLCKSEDREYILAAATDDDTIEIFNTAKKEHITTLQASRNIRSILFSPPTDTTRQAPGKFPGLLRL